MAVDELRQIDFIGINSGAGEAILTISDHLEWDDEYTHLITLQEKINAYLEFIEGGQLYEVKPEAENLKVVIEIIYKFAPPEIAIKFMQVVDEQLRDSLCSVRHRVLEVCTQTAGEVDEEMRPYIDEAVDA